MSKSETISKLKSSNVQNVRSCRAAGREKKEFGRQNSEWRMMKFTGAKYRTLRAYSACRTRDCHGPAGLAMARGYSAIPKLRLRLPRVTITCGERFEIGGAGDRWKSVGYPLPYGRGLFTGAGGGWMVESEVIWRGVGQIGQVGPVGQVGLIWDGAGWG